MVSKSANFLKVEVFRDGDQLVSLEFPAMAAAGLSNLIPPDSKDKIEALGISLAEIERKAVDSAYAPQLLFKAEVGNKRYRVWLE